ncbi:hypothetical protein [Brevundimonas vancanneytii]|uniref:hypothetical protein n=1 Tax=Brevundimonas vancanneytii TaxID=1325724 RepID=UPI0020956E7B|nr:hypothetical protein [Brevundimonas vancanneytii]
MPRTKGSKVKIRMPAVKGLTMPAARIRIRGETAARRSGGGEAGDVAVQGLYALGGGGHGGGVRQAAAEGALQTHDVAGRFLAARAARVLTKTAALVERGARDQGDSRQNQAGNGFGQTLRQGADGQGQSGGETDGGESVGDHQGAAQAHQATPGGQGGFQPGRRRRRLCDSSRIRLLRVDRLGRHYVSWCAILGMWA